MKKENYINHIPKDIEEFQTFINATDDIQKPIDKYGYSVIPKDKHGNYDYDNLEGRREVKDEPTYKRWDWTAAESKDWSRFREEYNKAYSKYSSENKDAKDGKGKEELEKIIKECIAYDNQNGLVQRVSSSVNTTGLQSELFIIKPDVLEYKHPFYTISLKHEALLPLSKMEKAYIRKYQEHIEYIYGIYKRTQKLRTNLTELHTTIKGLWNRMYISKDEADKAMNTIFMPPPPMKGSYSPVVQFYMPTAEESQKYANDFNEHYQQYHRDICTMCDRCTELEKELDKVKAVFNEEDKYAMKLFEELDDMRSKVFAGGNGTLDSMSVDDDHQNFLGSYEIASKETDAADDDWEEMVGEQIIFMGVYTTFTTFLQEKFNPPAREEKPFDVSAPPPPEADELKEETMTRYRADLANGTETYFDSQDWHVIMDHYNERRDEKNIVIAMKRARTLHPDEPTLLIREASMKMNEHKYQEALELMKQVEPTGPPYHPNYYSTKANIYMQLKTPELAIPLFRKLASQEAAELKWWRTYSYDQLIEIYDEKKDYEECILLSLETLKERKDDEHLVNQLAYFYCRIDKQDKAIKLLNDFLETHPKSSVCIERLALIYFEKKEYDKTIEYSDKSFLLDKNENYGALEQKGNALIELKKYQEALLCFELAHFHFKLTKEFHLGAGKCYVNLNIPQQAIYHYRKVLTLDADSKEALEALKSLGSKQESPLN